MSLEMTAPFPAVKSCIPKGDERLQTVATATAQKCALVYSVLHEGLQMLNGARLIARCSECLEVPCHLH